MLNWYSKEAGGGKRDKMMLQERPLRKDNNCLKRQQEREGAVGHIRWTLLLHNFYPFFSMGEVAYVTDRRSTFLLERLLSVFVERVVAVVVGLDCLLWIVCVRRVNYVVSLRLCDKKRKNALLCVWWWLFRFCCYKSINLLVVKVRSLSLGALLNHACLRCWACCYTVLLIRLSSQCRCLQDESRRSSFAACELIF